MTWWPRDGLHLGALTAPSSQPSLPAALFPSRRLILGCGPAIVPWCSPVFPGASPFGLLPGSTVPLDRALSGLTCPLMGLSLFVRLLGGVHIMPLWGTRSSLSLLRPSPSMNLFFSALFALWQQKHPVLTLQRSPLWGMTPWSWLITAEGSCIFLR